ncbi:hypothetical protein COOONC_25290 [Cooperia oncophora]
MMKNSSPGQRLPLRAGLEHLFRHVQMHVTKCLFRHVQFFWSCRRQRVFSHLLSSAAPPQ